jgi:hypothetical protein
VSFLADQPVVAQAAAAGREREKGLVEHIGDVEVVPVGQRVGGRQRDHPRFGEHLFPFIGLRVRHR